MTLAGLGVLRPHIFEIKAAFGHKKVMAVNFADST